MIRHVVSAIGGVGIFGVLSLVFFFTIFVSALVLSLCMKRSHAQTMGALPLDANDGLMTTGEVDNG